MTPRASQVTPPRRGRRRRWNLRALFTHVVRQRGSPEAIALGVALGLFIAFSPTIGIQLILAFLIATLCNANRLAALAPIWITNVFTAPPIYAFTYGVGIWLIPGRQPPVKGQIQTFIRRLTRHDFYSAHEQFNEILEISRDVFIPLLIGGLVVGLAAAAVGYPLTLWTVRAYRARRSRRLSLRALNRKRSTTADAPKTPSPAAGSTPAPGHDG